MFTNGSLATYRSLLEEIRCDFQPQTYESADLRVTVSIGLDMFQEGWSCDTIFQKADEAMYQSKEKGKNQITILG